MNATAKAIICCAAALLVMTGMTHAQVDCVLGFEQHTIRGKDKMELRVTLALVVMLAMALGRIRIGQADKLRSLVAPIDRAA